jgi:hypothetical protein
MGTQIFRVKRVPDPVAVVADKSVGSIDKNLLLLQQAVFAKMVDFDFDMKFTIQSFMLSANKGSYFFEEKSNGNRFSKEQLNLLRGVTSGSDITIKSIVAKGEDGTTRDLPSITLKIN